MFAVLIKYVDNGRTVWSVDGNPFEYAMDAEKAARARAAEASNTFAVVKVEAMFRRSVTVTQVEIAP